MIIQNEESPIPQMQRMILSELPENKMFRVEASFPIQIFAKRASGHFVRNSSDLKSVCVTEEFEKSGYFIAFSDFNTLSAPLFDTPTL